MATMTEADMNNTLTHPMAEAKVRVRTYGGGGWRDSVDFDPVMIPVEADGLTDAFNSSVYALSGALSGALIDIDCKPDWEYALVWSDSGATVKALCPVCDDVFPVAEGAPGDELNEGYDAVWCGCDPADQD